MGILFVLPSFAYSIQYYVNNDPDLNPSDGGECTSLQQPCQTIQGAIDKASFDVESTDAVKVYQGEYAENIKIEKNITLISNSGADFTIISSIATMDSDFGSVILIRPQSDNPHQPLVTIRGFTIEGGIGTQIYEQNSEGEPVESRVGGGIFAYVCSPTINNCIFRNNRFDDSQSRSYRVKKGSGLMAKGDKEDMDFSALTSRDYTDHDDLGNAVGPLHWENNTFENNQAVLGSSVYVEGSGFTTSDWSVILTGSHFDVAYTTADHANDGVPEYWVKGSLGVLFDYGDDTDNPISGEHPAITALEVYVDNNQDNGNTDDCGTVNNKCQTLSHTLTRVYSPNRDPQTIYLSSGSYNEKNDEVFPLQIHSNIIIEGELDAEGRTHTFINAENTFGGVLALEDVNNVKIKHLSVINGTNDLGGGIYMKNASAEYENIIVENNNSVHGAGIYCIENSYLITTDVTIKENNPQSKGAGIYSNDSYLTLSGGAIGPNFGENEFEASGIYSKSSTVSLTNVEVKENQGSGLYLFKTTPTLNNITVKDNQRHGVEIIQMPNNLPGNISGDSEISGNELRGISLITSHPILDGLTIKDNDEGGISLINSDPEINNLIIQSNDYNNSDNIVLGGGIYCSDSKPSLSNVIIENNTAAQGGGIFCEDGSYMTLIDVAIYGNEAVVSGGGVYIFNSDADFLDVNIYDNKAGANGGGIYLKESEVDFTRPIISDNEAENGGGMYFYGSDANIFNTTITNNSSTYQDDGACIYLHAFYNEDDHSYVNCNIKLYNSILWNNSGKQFNVYDDENDDNNIQSYLDIYFSDVEYIDQFMGETVINDLPITNTISNTQSFIPNFVNPELGNYQLLEGSGCIDAGSYYPDGDSTEVIIPDFEYVDGDGDGEVAPDMGAYEFLVCLNAIGDVNEDGSLNILDLVQLANAILGTSLSACSMSAANANGDGSINILDLVVIVNIILDDTLGGLQRGVPATKANVYIDRGICSYDADGKIAGLQLSVNGDFKIVNNNLPDGWVLNSNETIILIYSIDGSHLTDSRLFEYEGNIIINSILVADWYGSDIAVNSLAIPGEFSLSGAYPNPFNPVTTIVYGLPEDSQIRLVIYDLNGREVDLLYSGLQTAGYHQTFWNASSYSSGIYFVQFAATGFVKTHKLMLVK